MQLLVSALGGLGGGALAGMGGGKSRIRGLRLLAFGGLFRGRQRLNAAAVPRLFASESWLNVLCVVMVTIILIVRRCLRGTASSASTAC